MILIQFENAVDIEKVMNYATMSLYTTNLNT